MITFDECNFERNKFIEKSRKLEKENKELLKQVKKLEKVLNKLLIREQGSKEWWKTSMHGFDGDVAMKEHHTNNIRRIKNALNK
tara:strand:+ start:364 stop:615 length:252 start_codon:yes stop_codon:yes gene_type:complete